MSAATYAIADVALASSVPLPELAPLRAAADWTFALAGTPVAAAAPRWFHAWRAQGRRVVSFSRLPSGYLLRFHGKADFAIDLERRSIRCARRQNAGLSTIRHLLLDQVMPLLLSCDTRLVLHAAAVATRHGAIAFAGSTGSGKSTIAAAIAALGLPLLCDDCLVVTPSARGFHAGSFYPGARLFPDSVKAVGMTGMPSLKVASYTRKRRVVPSHPPVLSQSTPLACVFVLARRRRGRARESIVFTRLRGREALMALVACTFHLDVADPDAVRRGFDLQYRLVQRIPVYRLSYPWRLDRLSETRDAILGRIETDGA